MQVPRQWLDRYVDKRSEVSESAQKELKRMLRSLDYSRSPAEVRRDVVAIMEACCGGASDMSASVAAIFYDGLRERVVGSRMGAFAQSGRTPEATDKSVRAFLQKLFEGDYDEFERLCLERIDYEIKRASGRCIDWNVRHDPMRDEVRYARVPRGEKTCDFCIMVASRGPVYHTAESAGALDHWHAGCDCAIVPFWGTFEVGPSRRASAMSLEGYDPDALYGEYLNGKFGPSGTGRTSPQKIARSKADGKVTFDSVDEIQSYIKAATSYEDLFERIGLITSEWQDYGLGEKYRAIIQQTMREVRKSFIQ